MEVLQLRVRGWARRIDSDGEYFGARPHFTHELQALARHLHAQARHAGEIAAGRDRLSTTPSAIGSPPISKTIGIVASPILPRALPQRRPPLRSQPPDGGQIRCERRQPIILTFRPSKLDRDVAPLGVTGFRQALRGRH